MYYPHTDTQCNSILSHNNFDGLRNFPVTSCRGGGENKIEIKKVKILLNIGDP